MGGIGRMEWVRLVEFVCGGMGWVSMGSEQRGQWDAMGGVSLGHTTEHTALHESQSISHNCSQHH